MTLCRTGADLQVHEFCPKASAMRTMLVDGIIVMLFFGLLVGLFFGLLLGLFVGLLVGMPFWSLSGLVKGEIVTTTFPNEGIHRSAHNALLSGLIAWLFVGLLVGLLAGLLPGLYFGLVTGALLGLSSGLLVGLFVWLEGGGRACIQHYVLRIMLWRNGFAPLNYVRFLDFAAGRIFLRKVGGGYIFVHRLLLEYFASLEPEEEGG